MSFKNCIEITPDDDNDLPIPVNLFVGSTGDIVVIPQGGDSPVTFTAFPSNTLLPVRVKRVLATGTSATNLKGLWGA
jgi:hypothetical protein